MADKSMGGKGAWTKTSKKGKITGRSSSGKKISGTTKR